MPTAYVCSSDLMVKEVGPRDIKPESSGPPGNPQINIASALLRLVFDEGPDLAVHP